MIKKSSHNLYPAIRFNRKAPANVTPADTELFDKAIQVKITETKLFSYTNANVSPEGIVFKGLNLDKQLLIYPKHTDTYNKLYLLSSLVKRKKISLSKNENYLLIFDYWSNSIFHWMCDALPRLQAVKEQAKNCIVLLPENFEYPYIHESLKAFQLKGVYKMPVNTYVMCPRLLSPEQITVSGEIRPDNFIGLRKTILDYYTPFFKEKYTSPNIYISRSRAKYRKVLNEEDVLPVLDKYKFKVVFFEDMSFAEQVECCFNARNIVSIHGANLTNVIFMQPKGNVLEFRKLYDPDNNYFYAITDSVGCNYFYMNCETIDPKPGFNFFDLKVDVKALEKNIQLMLQQHD